VVLELKQKGKLLLLMTFLMMVYACVAVQVNGFLFYTPPSYVGFGEASIKVYIVALDGVNSHEVSNLSRAVKGALHACNTSLLRDGCYIFRIDPGVYGRIKLNIEATVITNWTQYRQVVENSRQAIIVNAHGETVPVPAGYAEEEWIDEIAEAMLHRNITWVHTAGYPFKYAWHQERRETFLGEEGLQQLMIHIGKPNITCRPALLKTELIGLDIGAGYALSSQWPKLEDAFWVEHGNPLNASDFERWPLLSLWGEDYLTGAIIKFAFGNDTATFGFYIHIGTYQTYDSDRNPTDSDFYRSYAGTASALYVVAMRTAAEDIISKAIGAIERAQQEGRIKGLEEAQTLLEETWNDYHKLYYQQAMIRADQAVQVAEEATRPSFIEAHGTYILTALAILATTSISALTIKRRNKHKREGKKT